MNKNKSQVLILISVLSTPLLGLVLLFAGIAIGLPEARIIKLIISLFPAAILVLILGSYSHGECIWFSVTRLYSNTRVAITSEKSPVLFHFLQIVFWALFFFLVITIYKLDINAWLAH